MLHGHNELKSLPKKKADFIEPMDCAPVPKLIDGPDWVYQIKLAGYRAVGVKSRGVSLFSRRHKSFNHQYPYLVEALGDLPEGTVVDGEVVALDESGRPNFNLLQSYRSQGIHIHYFIFDLLVCKGHDLTKLQLSERRQLMKSILKLRSHRIRIAEQFEASASDMLAAVRQQGLEGVIGKRVDSVYEPGKRTGAWVKYRVNRGQELVIGGYIPGAHGFDSLIVGYYRGKDLVYVARVRNGFVPASRRQVFERIHHLVSPAMPFANLPDTHKSRWGDELTAGRMKECVWLRPEAVAQIEFLEWTAADRLRHSKFVGLRDDKDARSVVKEQPNGAENRQPSHWDLKPKRQPEGQPRKIVGFHQDEELHWVADLECGHTQHVRHNPPWTVRHWVTTTEGRRAHIGHELRCPTCDKAKTDV